MSENQATGQAASSNAKRKSNDDTRLIFTSLLNTNKLNRFPEAYFPPSTELKDLKQFLAEAFLLSANDIDGLFILKEGTDSIKTLIHQHKFEEIDKIVDKGIKLEPKKPISEQGISNSAFIFFDIKDWILSLPPSLHEPYLLK